MLYQNFHGSRQMMQLSRGSYRSATSDAARLREVESEIRRIFDESSNILNGWNFKKPLDPELRTKLWSSNKNLRSIYQREILTGNKLFDIHFDDFINPPYGWDIALSDWN